MTFEALESYGAEVVTHPRYVTHIGQSVKAAVVFLHKMGYMWAIRREEEAMRINGSSYKVIDPTGAIQFSKYMEKHEISDEEMGKKLGVSPHAVIKYRSGQRKGSPHNGLTLRKIEIITGIPLEDWFCKLV